jgi:hypothetical protein
MPLHNPKKESVLPLDLKEMQAIARQENQESGRSSFVKEVQSPALLSALKSQAKNHLEQIQKWSYEQYVRYLHECFIDRNLDVHKESSVKRQRKATVFNSTEGIGELRSSTYMKEIEVCYGSLLTDFLSKKQNLLGEADLITSLWSDNFAQNSTVFLDKKARGVTSNYLCLAEDSLDFKYEASERLIQKFLQIKEDGSRLFFQQNFPYRDVHHLTDKTESQYYYLFRLYDWQTYNDALDNAEPEIAGLIHWFEERLKKQKDALSKAKTILDFTSLFELHHFFVDGNGRMELMLEHYLFLREGLSPLLTYNASSFPIDWLILNDEGKNLIIHEAVQSMAELMDAINENKPFNPQWRLSGEQDLTQSIYYRRYLDSSIKTAAHSADSRSMLIHQHRQNPLDLSDLDQLVVNVDKDRVRFFEKDLVSIGKKNHLVGEAKKHIETMLSWSYPQYLRYLHEIAIDRNLDLNQRTAPHERRTRRFNIFNVDEPNQGSQTKAYMSQIEGVYGSLLVDYLVRPEDALFRSTKGDAGSEIVQLWSDHFALSNGNYFETKQTWVGYGYSCIPIDFDEQASFYLIKYIKHEKAKGGKLFDRNYAYTDFVKGAEDSYRCHLLRDFGVGTGGKAKTLNQILDETELEITWLSTYFQKQKQKASTAQEVMSSILDFSGQFEMSHFFLDANGRMRWLLEHYLFLRNGFTPILAYNTGCFAIDWMILNEDGRAILLKESQLSMARLMNAINQNIPFDPNWSLSGDEDLTNTVVYQKYIKKDLLK